MTDYITAESHPRLHQLISSVRLLWHGIPQSPRYASVPNPSWQGSVAPSADVLAQWEADLGLINNEAWLGLLAGDQSAWEQCVGTFLDSMASWICGVYPPT